MKKKGTILAGLLLATIVTGYSVAGTYAKYTSAIDLTDEARVAKWVLKATDKNGVLEAGVNNIDLFASSYTLAKNGKTYVQSLEATPDHVVAPGTKGTYAFDLSGTIETRYNLGFDINAENDFVVYYGYADGKLVMGRKADASGIYKIVENADGSYSDATTTTTVDAVKEYRPLRYTVEYTHAKPNGWTADKFKDDKEVEGDSSKVITTKTGDAKALEKLYVTVKDGQRTLNTIEYGPGQVDKSYKITWEWKTENTENVKGGDSISTIVNELDTFAGKYLSSTKVTFNIKVVATQVAEDFSERA